ncbi:MAG: M28 family peptidase [Ignavibacteria bacterium]|nr:M28 family peptidase [Ignavibacteria bacterium]
MHKLKSIFVFTISLFSTFSIFCQQIDDPEITAEEIQQHINYFASDDLKGRDSGTEELFEASNYIKDEFVSYGLKPLFNESYLQEFSFIKSIELTENNKFVFSVHGDQISPDLNVEYTTVPFSGNAAVEGNLIFAGFGISASDLDYDDYEGIDVTGKVIIVMRNTPESDVPHSEFDAYSPLRKKASVARDKGAIGIIFVNPYNGHKKEDDLIDFEYDRGGAITEFPVINVKRSLVEKLFAEEEITFNDYYNKIIKTKKSASFEFKNSTASIKTEIEEVESISWNVGGYFEGGDPELKNEQIIIGAHFDHLGMGGDGSLYRGDEPQIHNGADDNASGTTGVLELAEKFSSVKNNLKRSVVFLAVSGEELGLLGSNYFVNNMPFPSENAITMINMDMIGRLKDSSLIVYGTGTSSNWKDILNEQNKYKFNLSFNDEGYGPSDHSSFYGKKIPVLFFFTGTHEDYHKPSDDSENINAEGEEAILNYIFNVAMNIDQNPERPDYLLVENEESGKMFVRRVYVGTIPDFAGNVDGYKISGVSEGSPAQIAGLKGGDIIIEFGGRKISNIYDFTYALADFVPGDIVDVVLKRGEQELTFTVELASK